MAGPQNAICWPTNAVATRGVVVHTTKVSLCAVHVHSRSEVEKGRSEVETSLMSHGYYIIVPLLLDIDSS